jgi:sensor histidine kinase YesM
MKRDEYATAGKKAVVAFLHVAYWLVYLLLLTIIVSVARIQPAKEPARLSAYSSFLTICVVPNLISFYAFYGVLFPRFLVRRKIFALLVWGALACALSVCSVIVLALFFFGFEQAVFINPREFLLLAASFFTIAAIHGAVALVIHGFIRWYEEIKLKEELARRNFEMEIALVKSQINPHFLFNTINNIDVLIERDAARASLYLNRLSDVLRYTVYETRSEKIPLAKEIDYIEKYLELQKIRTTNPKYVNFEIAGDPNALTVAPMILFPFIENAFKHTENRKHENSIRVKIAIEKGGLVFECENSYQPDSHDAQDFGGVGNALVARRLELLYGAQHSLETSDENGVYRVKLTLHEN